MSSGVLFGPEEVGADSGLWNLPYNIINRYALYFMIRLHVYIYSPVIHI